MRLLLIFHLIFLFLSSYAQQVSWQWGKELTKEVPALHGTDILGNINGSAPYGYSVMIGDTGFSHYGTDWPPVNNALFNWDRNGDLISLTDFYTIKNFEIEHFMSVTNPGMNVYAACDFRTRMFTGGEVINHGKVPYIFEKDICVMKLGDGGQPAWIKTISGFREDRLISLNLADSGLIIASCHWGNLNPNRIHLLGQDTIDFTDKALLVTVADSLGNPVRYNNFQFINGYFSYGGTTVGSDGKFYVAGHAPLGIVLGEDSIFNPSSSDPENRRPFIISMTSGGTVSEIDFPPVEMQLSSVAVTNNGYHCFSALASGTFAIGNDTLTLPGDSAAAAIFCTDSANNLKWHYFIKYIWYDHYRPSFMISSFGDSILFTTQCTGDFTFAGKDFHAGDSARLLTGLLSQEGVLGWYFLSEPVKGIEPSGIVADKCGNLSITGLLKGTFAFGPDTITVPDQSYTGFLARIERFAPAVIDLGPDTAVCDDDYYLLSGPPGFSHYCWNNGLSWQKDILVTQSGTYRLQAWNDGNCYSEGSVDVAIAVHPAIYDTTVYYNDTLILSAGFEFDEILWSTGDTGQYCTIFGSLLQPGNNFFWIRTKFGECTETDTFTVVMKYAPGTGSLTGESVMIFPNPAHDKVIVKASNPDGKARIKVFDASGRIVFSTHLEKEKTLIDVSGWKEGIYLFKIEGEEGSTLIKFIRSM